MSKIRVLSDRTANQIAAGEVIERPVGVVKELVENSLDAGAKRIEIEFCNGGKSYIRVEDNGSGMPPDEALLSLERHATSKIREVKDLDHITSLGFRGEALPSIASVSKFVLKTRAKENECGSEILVNGGKFVHQRDCGMAVGTVIEVTHLFNSVPARRKFLKTDNTEAAHIIHLSRLLAVVNPAVSFRLLENGRELFKSPVCQGLRERIAEVWGRKLAADLMELEAVENGHFRIHGLIGKPGIGRATRQELITVVNGRPVDSRTLSYALIESYHTLIPKGRYPVAFLFLEIDPAAVDVNVHPAKREVRFRDEGLLRQFVLQNLIDRLRNFSQLSEDRESMPVRQHSERPRSKSFSPVPEKTSDSVVSSRPSMPYRPTPPPALKAPESVLPCPTPPVSQRSPVKDTGTPRRLPWRLIGRLYGRYALFETEAGLVYLNLRAAHERIWFEKIQQRFAASQRLTQQLLLPVVLELEPLTATVLTENLDFLTQAGFSIAEFGRNFFRIEAVPDWLETDQSEPFVRDVLGLLREQGIKGGNARLAHEAIARLATTRAVRLDDHLSDAVIIDLAHQLMNCQHPLTCPRGHPTYFELPRTDIEKRFGR